MSLCETLVSGEWNLNLFIIRPFPFGQQNQANGEPVYPLVCLVMPSGTMWTVCRQPMKLQLHRIPRYQPLSCTAKTLPLLSPAKTPRVSPPSLTHKQYLPQVSPLSGLPAGNFCLTHAALPPLESTNTIQPTQRGQA